MRPVGGSPAEAAATVPGLPAWRGAEGVLLAFRGGDGLILLTAEVAADLVLPDALIGTGLPTAWLTGLHGPDSGRDNAEPSFELTPDEGEATQPFWDVQVDAGTAAGVAVSFGVMAWAARGSLLMTSLLVSSPAWRGFDLLPVLGRRQGEEGADDEEADPPPRVGAVGRCDQRVEPLS